MEEVAIKIEHVSKEYRLGAIGGGTLRGDLQSWWAKVQGKEDPNSKLSDIGRVVKGNTRFLALDDVSFEVKKGETLGIIGHNGAGKSTLLKLLSRVTAPTKGKISYDGRVASMLEVGTGFHPELTGRENVYMNGAILGMTRVEIDSKFDQIVEFAEMEQFIDTPVKRYSSGMYVKLAFSVAAHLDSEIMIMDEVLAVGDMQFQQKCLDKMRDAANRECRTVLYVSHNMNTIRRLCDRCIVLNKGKIVFDGVVEDAIGYYMSSAKALTVKNDCTGERNRKYGLDGSILIKEVEFLNVNYPIYKMGEELVLRILFSAKRDIRDMAIRLSVLTKDKIIVGQATTRAELFVCVGENSVDVTLNTDSLAPGKYIMKIVAYEVNQYGGNKNLDVVEEACAFEKMQYDCNNNMVWNHNWWGYLMFPELKVNKGDIE